jgi:ATP-binding cassette, subfamily B, bacterial
MRRQLRECLWEPDQAVQALDALARRVGLSGASPESSAVPAVEAAPLARAAAAGRAAGLDVDTTSVDRAAVPRLMTTCAPALLVVEVEDRPSLVAVVDGGRRRMTLLGPDGRTRRVGRDEVEKAFVARREREAVAWAEGLLRHVEVPGRRRRLVLDQLARERMRGHRIGGCLLVGLSPGASFPRQLRRTGVLADAVRFVLAYAGGYALLLGSWWMLGRGVLTGRLEAGWLLAWALMLASTLPFRAVSVWSRARLTLGFGALFKRRLLLGALRLAPDEARRSGLGQLLGRVIESEAVETMALNGGFLVVVAAVELILSAVVLTQSATAGIHLAVLAVWTAAVLLLSRAFFRRRTTWTEQRLDMTHDLVERLLGHRTRLAQERRETWHHAEDGELREYHDRSFAFDRLKASLLVVAPRGWLLVGIAASLPAFLAGEGTAAGLAIGLGGTLAAYRGFGKLAEGLSHISGAVIGWRQAARLFAAAARGEGAADRSSAAPPAPASASGGRLTAHELRYRHQARGRDTLSGASLTVAPGDRIFIEGGSGSGKSTLVALLAALRRPDAGLLLVDGFDPHTLGGDGWRRRVVAVPQFHENHVVAGSLALNLLLGRGWPPLPGDEEAAAEVCRELGLGDLLDRMPGGLQQFVGESGWQLSHGEASRLYLARALLQDAPVVVLDETLAALDPESFMQALDCVERRARALVVVAHR